MTIYPKQSNSLFSKLDDFQKAINDVEQCSNANITDCPGIPETYKRDTDAAIALLEKTNIDKDSLKAVKDAVKVIEGVQLSKDQDKLDTAAEDLNRILILAKMDQNLGASVAGPNDLIIGVATETIDCA
ncbi:hypothetical protein BGZ83_003496, partial [Gryganskiella cystojenkinii]